MAFRGHYDYSLDAKNRLNITPKFRAAFSDGLVLSKALEPCVWIFTPDGFERFMEGVLPGLNPVSPRRRGLTRYFAGNSFDAELDSAGRVTLNPSLMAHAGIEKDVVVVGHLDRLEVWDRQKWQEHERELSAEIGQIAESLDHPS